MGLDSILVGHRSIFMGMSFEMLVTSDGLDKKML